MKVYSLCFGSSRRASLMQRRCLRRDRTPGRALRLSYCNNVEVWPVAPSVFLPFTLPVLIHDSTVQEYDATKVSWQ